MLKLLHFCHVPAARATDTEEYYNQLHTKEPETSESKGDA